jgi:hypothetical protein
MKVLSKPKLKKIFKGRNRTGLNDVMTEIAIMKKLVLQKHFSYFNLSLVFL